MAATVSPQTGTSNAANASSYTYTSAPLGTAASDRLIVVGVAATGVNNSTISSITVAGISATIVLDKSTLNANVGFGIAAVPSGTTGDIVVTFSAGKGRANAIVPYACYGMDSTLSNSNFSTGSSTGGASSGPGATATLNVPAGGAAFGIYGTGDNVSNTWANLTEQFDAVVETTAGTSAYSTFASAQSGLSISATQSGSSANVAELGLVSFGPAAAASTVRQLGALGVG